MQIFNSASRKKEPLNQEKINIYLCGPTVYDDAHLGHARSAVAFDLLRRVLLANGKIVKFARNYTDIDDKLINKSAQTGQSVKEIAEFYIKRFDDDMSAIKIMQPDITPRATEYVQQMIDFVALLLKAGHAYAAEDGIYLDSSKDEKYLSLSKKDLSDAQSRLDGEQAKKNEHDFVLWKFAQGYYDAPFGGGRPGWHTECVCMILDIFGGGVDIHCGGADLFFPHHENEACQCRLATASELAKIWCHNGFVRINDEKMSKSLGNSFFIKDALKITHPEALRLYLSSVHYRADFSYHIDDLKACSARLDKLYRLLDSHQIKAQKFSPRDFGIARGELLNKLLAALNDDLNISAALAIFDEWLNIHASKRPSEADLAAIRAIFAIGEDENYFQIPNDLLAKANELIAKRQAAKDAKDFALADNIRDELASMQIAIKDTKDGTKLEYLGNK